MKTFNNGDLVIFNSAVFPDAAKIISRSYYAIVIGSPRLNSNGETVMIFDAERSVQKEIHVEWLCHYDESLKHLLKANE